SAVCSMDLQDTNTVGAEEIERLEEEGVLVTTAPRVLYADLCVPGACTVFTTYASLPAVAALHAEHGLPAWDLAVVDEAHRSAGTRAGAWARVHDDAHVPCARRLYMTATPRLYGGGEH